MLFDRNIEAEREARAKAKKYVKSPRQNAAGVWVVEIALSPSPLAEPIETIECTRREGAYSTHRYIKKQLGQSF